MDRNVNRPRRLLTDRTQSKRAILWGLDTHRERLSTHLPISFFRPVAGLPVPAQEEAATRTAVADFDPKGSVESFLLTLREGFVNSYDGLTAAERSVRSVEARGKIARRGRDAASEDLGDLLVKLRGALPHVVGLDELDGLGFAQRTEILPERLLEQAVTVDERLQDLGPGAPEPQVAGLGIDWGEVSKKLGAARQRLNRALEDVAESDRLFESALADRDRALATYHRVFLWVARTVESMFQLAGFADLAARVRPSERRPGETEVPFEEPEEGQEEEQE